VRQSVGSFVHDDLTAAEWNLAPKKLPPGMAGVFCGETFLA
jgi:hypothetical protein